MPLLPLSFPNHLIFFFFSHPSSSSWSFSPKPALFLSLFTFTTRPVSRPFSYCLPVVSVSLSWKNVTLPVIESIYLSIYLSNYLIASYLPTHVSIFPLHFPFSFTLTPCFYLFANLLSLGYLFIPSLFFLSACSPYRSIPHSSFFFLKLTSFYFFLLFHLISSSFCFNFFYLYVQIVFLMLKLCTLCRNCLLD